MPSAGFFDLTQEVGGAIVGVDGCADGALTPARSPPRTSTAAKWLTVCIYTAPNAVGCQVPDRPGNSAKLSLSSPSTKFSGVLMLKKYPKTLLPDQ